MGPRRPDAGCPRVEADAKGEEVVVSPRREGRILSRATGGLLKEKAVAHPTRTSESLGKVGSELANTGSAFQRPH